MKIVKVKKEVTVSTRITEKLSGEFEQLCNSNRRGLAAMLRLLIEEAVFKKTKF